MISIRRMFEVTADEASNIFLVQATTPHASYGSSLLKSDVLAKQMKEKTRREKHLLLRRKAPVENV
ncbi:MAG: hypothetical protein QW835_00230 [Candidatus Hadarchaeum sp.]